MAKKRIQGTDRLFEETEAVTSSFSQAEEPAQRSVPKSVPIHLLVPNRHNPRQAYSKETLEELARSIAEYGFIGALDGRELPDGRVELAYGSRRLLAARMAGIQAVPVFLHDWHDEQMRFLSLVENLAREDLAPIDEVVAVGQMHDDLGLSTREISRRIGQPRSWVQDRLALVKAPGDVKGMVAERPDTLRAARFVARLTDEKARLALRAKILAQEITTRQVQQVVQQIEAGTPAADALATIVSPQSPASGTGPARPVQRRSGSAASSARVATRKPSKLAVEPDEKEADQDVLLTSVVPAEEQPLDAFRVFEQETPFAASIAAAQPPASPPTGASSSGRTLLPVKDTPIMPERRWAATGSPLIVLAVEALDSFNPDGLPEDELRDALTWVRQLATKTNLLLQDLEERL